ncbi:ankyrin [Skunkpox virus]|uniref:Ankyrin n=1 Tax=Skunkpox virus TaxID=160796 RepID=A0A1C9KBG2_9POXV|nr:ankyrin [Skunkpox virus]AOP31497.1 ankyrin [Skunkpox virus]
MVNDKSYSEILYNRCKTFEIDACSAQSLIKNGASPLYQYDCNTPLRVYVTKENVNIKSDVVISLLEAVDYININDFDIFEYIHCENIDIDLLKLLINKGLKINGRKNNINIVEKYATTKNPNVDVFNIFFEQGIPICSDIRYGFKIVFDTVKLYPSCYDIDEDYDYVTDDNDKMGKTALYYYIISRPRNGISLNVLNCLLSYDKCNFTYRRHTTLYYYIGRKDIKREIFDVLYSNGNYLMDERMNILARYLLKHYRNKNYEFDNYIIDKLLCNCINYNIVKLCNHLRDNTTLLSIILKKYKDSIQDLLNEYILLSTVYLNVIKFMVGEGAVLYRFNHINKYFLSIGNKDPKVVEYILKNGVETIGPDDNENNDKIDIMPLFSIFMPNELVIIKILELCMPYIDDINKLDRYGCSILYRCVNGNNTNIVKWLVDNGADINVVTKYGHTCITICIVMSQRCIDEVSKKYIDILEIILRKLPTIECIKKTMEYFNNSGLHIYHTTSIKELCIKYFVLVDYEYVCITYPSFINYIAKCKNELDDMFKTKIYNIDMYTLMYKINKYMRKRFVKHPVFTEWAKTQYTIYTEIIDEANDFIKRNEEIDNLIDEVSVNNNWISILPLEIKDLIFSYAFL